MYTSLFTEFSYGYALTDNIIHGFLPPTHSAPAFPSLIAEGSSGGGYDVKIPSNPVPLFLQFKIPQVIRRNSIHMPRGFSKPYLRMHLRTKRPNQHSLLLALEAKGNLVAYATPDFWTISELDSHFVNQRVHLRSCYFLPSEIGNLDENAHYIAYCTGVSDAWLFSKPKHFGGSFTAESFDEHINTAVNKAPQQDPLQFLKNVKSSIVEITEKEPLPQADTHMHGDEKSELRRVMREVSYLALVRLGCTLIIVGRMN